MLDYNEKPYNCTGPYFETNIFGTFDETGMVKHCGQNIDYLGRGIFLLSWGPTLNVRFFRLILQEPSFAISFFLAEEPVTAK